MDAAAPQHVESSQAGDGTHVSCVGWQILIPMPPGKFNILILKKFLFLINPSPGQLLSNEKSSFEGLASYQSNERDKKINGDSFPTVILCPGIPVHVGCC